MINKKGETINKKIKTPNLHFNDAWKILQEKSGLSPIAQTYCIDISKKPKLTKEEWHNYVGSLIEVILIGSRNNWISIHVDGRGRISYIVFRYPLSEKYFIDY